MAFLGKWFGFDREEVYEQGLRAYDRGDWEGAIERFETCLDHAGDDKMIRLAQFYLSDSYAELGVTFIRAGDNISAVRNLSTAIEMSPHYPDRYVALAQAYRGLGINEARTRAIDRALEINPRYLEAIRERGLLAYEEGRYSDAQVDLGQWAASDPVRRNGPYRRALARHAKGDVDGALALLLELSSDEGDEGAIHAKIAQNYMRERMYEDAALEFEKSVNLSPRYADVHCKYGQVLIELGRAVEAEQQIRYALQVNPRYVEAHAMLGVALSHLEQTDHADAAFRRALDLDPDNEIAQRYLA